MKYYYVTYEVNRDIHIATRKPKSGTASVKFKTKGAAKLFRIKVINKRS